jgi:hypothetical protein
VQRCAARRSRGGRRTRAATRRWGSYHSYDYAADGPPPRPGIVHDSVDLGRGPLVPEVLSGCRKAPILAVGINPNLPGWWRWTRSSVNPLFDDYQDDGTTRGRPPIGPVTWAEAA